MNALELKNITKTFGAVYANKNVSIDVKQGEILSILGENGSGKTTLMNMVAGIYFPDEGQIFVNGKEVVIKSPKDAFDNKKRLPDRWMPTRWASAWFTSILSWSMFLQLRKTLFLELKTKSST